MAQKLAQTTFRVVPNCARGYGGWIKLSSSLAREASVLAFGQPARFARGLDNRKRHRLMIKFFDAGPHTLAYKNPDMTSGQYLQFYP